MNQLKYISIIAFMLISTCESRVIRNSLKYNQLFFFLLLFKMVQIFILKNELIIKFIFSLIENIINYYMMNILLTDSV